MCSRSRYDYMSKEMMGVGGRDELGNLGNPSRGPMSSGLPSWKLYDNPFYKDHHHGGHHHHHPSFAAQHPYNHALLPISARKLAASLWDVATLFHPMDPAAGGGVAAATTPELHLARARIRELKAELDFERRLRKKAEALSRALAREAAEERARREAEERAREGLAMELARARGEAGELRREVEEERRMMRVAEAMREERVQMKLAEARLLMEEKLMEMRGNSPGAEAEASSRTKLIPAMGEESWGSSIAEDGGRSGVATERDGGGGGNQQRKEPENPHIRRGIKGFVEFPKVGRSRAGWPPGPREGKEDPGPKLECQMAQLRVLLKHRVPVGLGSSSGSVNLVM